MTDVRTELEAAAASWLCGERTTADTLLAIVEVASGHDAFAVLVRDGDSATDAIAAPATPADARRAAVQAATGARADGAPWSTTQRIPGQRAALVRIGRDGRDSGAPAPSGVIAACTRLLAADDAKATRNTHRAANLLASIAANAEYAADLVSDLASPPEELAPALANIQTAATELTALVLER